MNGAVLKLLVWRGARDQNLPKREFSYISQVSSKFPSCQGASPWQGGKSISLLMGDFPVGMDVYGLVFACVLEPYVHWLLLKLNLKLKKTHCPQGKGRDRAGNSGSSSFAKDVAMCQEAFKSKPALQGHLMG